ncbi:hypothetical protein K8352_00250 [Flavobacteriaceae bacterium F89]|uniref:Uncharacterized protein n=1 Tax=Cerina litoralis TaxID=2874477 RepID=A0AAE3ETA6_9FLAO|nr:hypothetical protein [Cerina litoralis]
MHKNQIEGCKLPMWPYTLIHSDKKLSEWDKELSFNWINSTPDRPN